MEEILGLQLFHGGDLLKLLARLSIDLVFATLIIRGIYTRFYGRGEYAFTCFMLNVITFALCFLLRKVPIELGFALGLFAVFGILRYRTEPINIRDLTYLFVVIGLAILTAVANKKISLVELVALDTTVVVLIAVHEFAPWHGREGRRTVLYDNLPLLSPDKKAALLEDLCSRTGLAVERVSVQSFDLLRDTALLHVYYEEPSR